MNSYIIGNPYAKSHNFLHKCYYNRIVQIIQINFFLIHVKNYIFLYYSSDYGVYKVKFPVNYP